MSGDQAGVRGDHAIMSGDASALATIVGTLQVLFGAVTIARPGAAPVRASIGDVVREGDALDTGDDGVVVVAFLDGTTLHLHANGHLVLDGLSSGPDEQTVVRIVKGVFGVIWGTLTAAKHLDIDTPVGRLRTKSSAAGLGSIALGVFTFALIRDLKADSADIAFIDNGTIDWDHLKHGVYEIILEAQNGQPPRVIVVDDPTQTIVIRHTSSGYSVQSFANSPLQMAQNQNAYSHAFSTYSEGQQDPFIQQWQHANAQPQSNPGGEGSSTSIALLALSSGIQEGAPTGPQGNNFNGGGSINGGTLQSAVQADLASGVEPARSVIWTGGIGSWDSTTGWYPDAPWTPLTAFAAQGISQNITIDSAGSLVTISNGAVNPIGSLNVGANGSFNSILGDNASFNSTLEVADGTLTVGGLADIFGTIEAVDPNPPAVIIFNGPVTIEAIGTIAAVGGSATITFADASTVVPGTTYTVEDFGTIAAADDGTINFAQGSLDNKGTVIAGSATIYEAADNNTKIVSVPFPPNGAGHGEVEFAPGTTVTNEGSGLIAAVNDGTVLFDTSHTIINAGLLSAIAGGVLEVQDSVINNTGITPLALGNPTGILIGGVLGDSASLLVDTPQLTLDGKGEVALQGGIISGAAPGAGNELENVDNTIFGFGTVSNVILINDMKGVIDATGGTLSLVTATIDNGGLLEATAAGELDVKDSEIDNTGTSAINTGIVIDGTSTLQVDVPQLTLDGGGDVALQGTIAGAAPSVGNELDNLNNFITVTGTAAAISNLKVVINDASTFVDNDSSPVGGGIEVTSGAVLTLDDGTQIVSSVSGTLAIDNGGQLSIASVSGAILDGVVVDDDTTAAGNQAGIVVASGSVLKLDDGAQIQGGGPLDESGGNGTLTIQNGGQLSITSASGAVLDGVAVEDDTTTTGSQAGIDVVSTLTLNDGTTISGGVSGGTLTLESGAQLIVTAGNSTDGASPSGAIIQGVTVDDLGVSPAGMPGTAGPQDNKLIVSGGTLTLTNDTFGDGVIEVTVYSGATLILNNSIIEDAILNNLGGNIVYNGVSKIEAINSGLAGQNTVSGTLLLVDEVLAQTSGVTLTISGGILTDEGTIEVETSGAKLTLSDGSQISGGAIFNDLTVNDVANLNGIQVGLTSAATLALENGTLISGGYLDVESSGHLWITGSSGATLDAVVLDDDGTGSGMNAGIYVSGGTLTLQDGTEVEGGGIGTMVVAGDGKVVITKGGAALDGLFVTDNNTGGATRVSIDVSGATLTLDDSTQISGGGTGTLRVESDGELLITPGKGDDTETGSVSGESDSESEHPTIGGATLDGMIVTNAGELLVTSGATLTLSNDTVDDYNGSKKGSIEVSGAMNGTGSGSILELTSTTTIDGGDATVSGATLNVDGLLKADGGTDNTIENFAAGMFTNDGQILVTGSGTTLTLSNDTVDDYNGSKKGSIEVSGAMNGTGSGSILELTSTTTIDGGDATVSGATLNVDGLLKADGGTDNTIENFAAGMFTNDGQILVTGSGTTLTLSNDTVDDYTAADGGTIQVMSGTLTLDGNTLINGGGTGLLTIESGGQVFVTTAGATLDHITVTDGSAFATDSSDLVGGGIEVTSGAVLTLDDGTQIVSSVSGTLAIDNGGQLSIASVSGAILDGVVVDDDTTAAGNQAGIVVASGSVLKLDDGAQIQGGGPLDESGGNGTLTIQNGGQLSITSASGAVLDGVAVEDDTTTTGSQAGIDVVSTLTLNDGTTISGGVSGGTLTLESGAQLIVTAGNSTDGASPSGAIIQGVTVDDLGVSPAGMPGTAGPQDNKLIVSGGTLTLTNDTFGDGVIEVTVYSGATLILNNSIIEDAILNNLGGNIVYNGVSKIEAINSGLAGQNTVSGTLLLVDEVLAQTSGVTLTISGGILTDEGTIEVETSGAKLTLSDGSQISGGAIFNDLTVNDVANLNGIQVGLTSAATLALENGTLISGGYLDVESSGHLWITGSSGATLDAVVLDDDGTGSGMNAGIYVSGGTLTLQDGTEVEGGGIGTMVVAGDGKVVITKGGAALDGLFVTDNNTGGATRVSIDVSGATLTLDDSTQISGGGTGTLRVESDGELLITPGKGDDTETGSVSGESDSESEHPTIGGATLDGMIVTNAGELLVTSGATLTLSNDTVDDYNGSKKGSIEVSGAMNGTGSGSILELTSTTTIDGGDATVSGATLNVDGLLKADGGTDNTIENFAAGMFTNDGQILVTGSGTTLTLSNDTVDDYNGTNAGSIQVDGTADGTGSGSTLQLQGTTINGGGTASGGLGSLTNDGLLEVTSGATNVIENFSRISGAATFVNNGELWVTSGATLTLTNDYLNNNPGVIQVDLSSQLNLNNTTLSGGRFLYTGFIQFQGTATSINYSNVTIFDHGYSGNPFADPLSVILTITGAGTLAFDGATTGLTPILDGRGGVLEVSGTIAAIDTALHNGLAYNPTNPSIQNTLTFNVSDGSGEVGFRTETVNLSGGVLTSTVAGSSGYVVNAGKIDVQNTTSTLSDIYLNNANGTLQVDSVLNLQQVNIKGGAITDNGNIQVMGHTGISNASLSSGKVTVYSGVTLGLDNVTISGTTINNIASDSVVVVDDNDTLTLNAVVIGGGTINDGTVANSGALASGATIDVIGNSTISGATLNYGVVDVSPGMTLVTDGDTMNGTTLTDTTPAFIKIDNADTLTISGVTISDLTIQDGGTLHVTGASEIEDATITGGTVLAGQTLTLNTDTLDNVTLSGSYTGVGTDTLDDVTLSGATISGGTLDISGTLTTTAASTIESATVPGGTVLAGQTLTLNTDTLDNVTLSGSYTGVGTDTLDDVTLSGATISGGTLDISGTLTTTAASTIESATVPGGTVLAGQTLTLNTDTLDNVTLSGSYTGVGTDTLDDVTLSGATISGGTLDISGTLTTTATSTIESATVSGGTVLAGQTLTLSQDTLDDVTLTGSGTFVDADTLTIDHTVTLSGATISGGTIDDNGSLSGTLSVITSSEIENATVNGGGTLSVASGQTLTLSQDTLDDVTLTGSGTFVDADTLTIDHTVTLSGATISGGTIDDNGSLSGTLSVITSSEIENATVNGGGTLSVASGQTLTLSQDTLDDVTLTGSGTFVDADTLTIDHTVTLSGATISGGTIDDNGSLSGTLSVITSSEIENATVNGGGTLSVASGQTLTLSQDTLDDVTLTGSGTFVDADTLTIDHTVTLSGATISGGTIDDNGSLSGTLSVITSSEIENATVNGGGTLSVASGQTLTLSQDTLDDVTLTGSGTFVDADTLTIDHTVTLSGATISGGTIDDNGSLSGTLSVITSSEIENATVNGGGTLSVASGQTLTLSQDTLDDVTLTGSGTFVDADTLTIDHTVTLSGATISGGTIDDNGSLSGTLSVITSSEIENATVNGGGTLSVASGQTLTLSQDTLDDVTLTGSGTFVDADTLTIDHTVTLSGATISGGTIDDNGSLSGTLSVITSSEIENATVNGGGTLSVASGQTLTLSQDTLDDVTLTGSGTFVDADTLTIDHTVTLSGATISGGTIDDNGSLSGTLSVITSSEIENATVNGGGTLSVASGQTLTLSQDTLDDVTLTGSGTFVDADTLTIDHTVTLSGATISGGTIDDNGSLSGTLSVITSSEIENATVNGGGTLSVASGQTLTLSQDTLDDVTLTGSGTFVDADTLTIDHTVTLSGATISGGTIDDNGSLSGTLSVITSSEIENATVNGGGTLSVASGQTLTLSQDTLDDVTLTGSGTFVDADTLTIDHTVTLSGATISGGTIDDNGSLSGTLSVITSSEIENATVNGGGTLSVASGQTLTLSQDTLDDVTLTGSGTFVDADTLTIDHTVTLSGATISGGTIDDNGSLSGTLSVITSSEIENATVNGGGTLSVASGQTLTLSQDTLDDVTLTGSGTFVDADTLTIDHTVTLSGATISGGTIDDNGSLSGTLSVITSSEIENATVNGGGTLSVASGQTLTLSQDTLDDVTLTGSGTFVDADTLTIDHTVTLSGATISGGTIDDNGSLSGTLSVITSSEIENATVNGGGTLSVASGQTLTLSQDTLDDVTLTGSGTFVDADTLTIDHTVTLSGATISGGTIDDNGSLSGTLSVITSSEIENATVNGGGTLSVASGQTLTLSQDTLDDVTLTGSGTFVDADTLTIDHTVTLSGATISGGTIDDNGSLSGTLSVITSSEIENATVNGGGTLSVASGQTLTLSQDTLDDVTLTGSGTFVDADTLTIDHTVTLSGATISGGTIDDNGSLSGTLSVITSSEIENATVNGGGTLSVASGQTLTLSQDTLDDVTLTGSGTFVDADTLTIDHTVTLSGATISGGTIDDNGSLSGTLSVITSSEIENATVNGGGTLSVASGQTLTLSQDTLDDVTLTGSGTFVDADTLTIDHTVTLSGATISGGTIDDNGSLSGTLSVITSSEIENATVNGGGTLSVASGQTLTLSQDTLDDVTLTGSGTFVDADTLTIDHTVTLSGATISGGTIDDNGSLSGTLSVITSSEIENATVNGGGTLSVASGQTLTLSQDTLDDVTLTGSGTFVDADTLTIDHTVTLSGATISGGTIDDNGSLSGTLSVITSSEIENATVNGGGTLSVASGQTLTLSQDTLDDVTLTGSGTFVDADTLTIDHTVTLSGATISGGTIDDNGSLSGTLSVITSSEIENATVNGGGTLSVASGQTLTLSQDTLDDVTLTGSGTFVDADTLTIDHTVTLSGATISGGTIDDNGSLSGTLSVITSSEIENATVNGGGTLSVASGQTLTLSQDTLDDVTLTGSGTFVDADTLTIDHTVTLSGATISGGTIDDNGSLSGTLSVITSSEIENATVNGGGTLSVASGQTLTLSQDTLDDVTLTGSGTFVDADTLTIDHTVTLSGATISGGTIDDNGSLSGTLSVITSSEIENATVNGGGTLSVASGQTLTLAGDSISGTTISGGTVDISGTLTVTGATEIESATINGGTIDVEATTLTLAGDSISGTTISGGTVDISGPLTVTGATTIENASVSGGTIDVGLSQILTLGADSISGTTISGGTVDISGTLTVTGATEIESATINGGTIDVEVTTLTLAGDSIGGTTISGGTVDISGPLTVTGATTIENASVSGGTIDVGLSQILTLGADSISGTTISGGTVDISGTLTVTGATEIESATINGGTIDVEATTLTLAGDSISGTTISGGTVDISGPLTVTGATTIENASVSGGTIDVGLSQILTLGADSISGTTISGGTVDISGTLTVTGATEIESATINGGTIDVEVTTLTLAGDSIGGTTISGGTVDISGTLTVTGATEIENATVSGGTIDASGATLTLSHDILDGVTLTGAGTFVDADTMTIHDTVTLSGATISGGILDISGTLTADPTNTLSGESITIESTGAVDATGILTISGGSLTNSGGVLEANGGTLTVDIDVSGNGSATITGGGVADFNGAFNENVTFAGAGTLELNQADTGTITGFATSQTIDLHNLAYTSPETAVWSPSGSGGTLTITNKNGSAETINLVGTYTQNSFALTSDGSGATPGTDVIASPTTVTLSGLDGSNNAVEGQAASVSLTGSPSNVTYTWLDNGQVIAGENGASYTPVAGDVGQALDVVVSFTDPHTGNLDQVTALAGTVSDMETGPENPVLGGVSGTIVGTNAQVTLGATVTAVDSDDVLSNVTVAGLPTGLNASSFNGGSYNNGTWIGTVAQFNALTFNGGTTTGTFALGITVSNTTSGEQATTTSSDFYNLVIGTGSNISGSGTYTFDSDTTLSGGTVSGSPTFDVTSGTTLTFDDSISSGGTATFNLASGGSLDIGTTLNSGSVVIEGSGTGGTGIINSAAELIVEGSTTVTANANILKTPITIEDGATLIITGNVNSTSSVTFTAGSTGTNVGTLVLDNPAHFGATIFGFTGADSTPSNSDKIELPGYNAATFHENFSSGVLSVSDGTNSATINFSGSYTTPDFLFQSYTSGSVTGVVIYDPPSLSNLTVDSNTVLGIGAASSATITFANGNGSNGTLVLDDSQDFTGQIVGFAGDGTVANSDSIDLGDINFANLTQESYSENSDGAGGTLTLTDGVHSSNIEFVGNFNLTDFKFSSDGAGGTVIRNAPLSQAGAAGSSIKLGLTNPPAANGGPVTVTVSGLPSDWQLNEGTNLGNDTWSIQSSDLSSLTVLTAAAFAGAMALSVTETWANADGTTGTATIADNVATYAPNSPIFALSNNDTLTGAGGNDLFVFAQPISNDTIHNFNVASDQIDLIGFSNVASFSDVYIADDANGNAVITLGSGETITLQGVDAASLTANNFELNQTPAFDNSGTMIISDGAELPISGVVNNSGIIELKSTGDLTELVIIGSGATLEGGGQITLSANSVIVGTNSSTVLTNIDNTISGAGQIGTGDGNLTLVNGAHGTIDANVSGGELTLDSGNAITNAGIFEVTHGGTLLIDDPVNGGAAIIAGGTLDFAAKATTDVTFNNGASIPVYGDLVLGAATDYSGQIFGFTGTQPDAAHSDMVDLSGFAFSATTFAEAVSSGNLLTLTATDGTSVATLTFDNFNGTLDFASDGNGGTLITDPPSTGSATDPSVLTSAVSTATTEDVRGNLSFVDPHNGDAFTGNVTPNGADYQGSFTLDQPTENNGQVSVNFEFKTNNDQMHLASGQVQTQSYDVAVADVKNPADTRAQTVSVTIGGPGNDHFVFAPGIGEDTIANFNPQQDTIELDHFANAQTVQELQALISADVHGDAVLNLGHNDGITLANVTETQLQHIIQAGHVLLH